MKKVLLYLDATEEDLEDDRGAISGLLNTLNDRYEKLDLYFRLVSNAGAADGVPMNAELIAQSDAVFVILCRRASPRELSDFEAALAAFQKNGKPKIFTFFKAAGEPDSSVKDLMERLDRELQHYYETYTCTDTLLYRILLRLSAVEARVLPEYRDGALQVNGRQIMTVANVAEFLSNGDLRKLRAEFDRLTEQFHAARDAALGDGGNEEKQRIFLELSARRNAKEKELCDLENAVFDASARMAEETANGPMSARRREAYRLFEQGDYAGANRTLDFDEIADEADRSYRTQQQGQAIAANGRKKQRECADELLQKIGVLRSYRDDPDRFAEIEQCYRKIVEIEKRAELQPAGTKSYMVYLFRRNDTVRAKAVRTELLRSLPESMHDTDGLVFAARTEMAAGEVAAADSGLHAEAERNYLNAAGIFRVLAGHVSSVTERDLADCLNILGILYQDTNRLSDAEKNYRQALEIWQRLAEKDPDTYGTGFAAVCNNLGTLCRETRRWPEAEAYLKKTNEICAGFAAKDPDTHLRDLAGSCYNLGVLYSCMGRLPEAEDSIRKALDIDQRLAEEDPAAFEPDLADACNVLGKLYTDTGRFQEAERFCLKAQEIYRRLAAGDPGVFGPRLAKIEESLGRLYSCTGRPREAEETYLRVREAYRRLTAGDPTAFEPDLARSNYRLGRLYCDLKRPGEAEKYLLETVEPGRRLAKKDPAEFEPVLADSFHRLGDLCCDQKRLDEAEGFFLNAEEIYRRLAAKDPGFEPNLAGTLAGLGFAYSFAGKKDAASQKNAEALAVYRHLEAVQPGRYARAAAFLEKLLAASGGTITASPAPPKAARQLSPEQKRLVSVFQRMAEFCRETGDLAGAKEAYGRAAEAVRLPPDSGRLNRAAIDAYGKFWAVCRAAHRYGDARDLCLEELEFCKKLAAEDPARYEADLGACYNDLGITRYEDPAGRREAARDAWQNALEIYSRLAEKEPQTYSRGLTDIRNNLRNLS